MAATFALVVIGWVFFRADSIAIAFDYLGGMLQFGTLNDLYRILSYEAFWFCLLMLIEEWLQRKQQHGLSILPKQPFIRYSVYIILVLFIFFFGADNQTFIYFQF